MSRSRRRSTPAPDAREAALRALRTRDLSVSELTRRLRERGIAENEAGSAIEALVRTGVVDDARLVRRRAELLAERGAGDRLVRERLRALAVDAELVDQAVAALDPELDRAGRVVSARGLSARSARYLARKGFSEETIHALVASQAEGELG